MLALMYIVEYSDGFNALPNPLDRALTAAQRAVDLGPTHALGHDALAFVYFFRKEKLLPCGRWSGPCRAQSHGDPLRYGHG